MLITIKSIDVIQGVLTSLAPITPVHAIARKTIAITTWRKTTPLESTPMTHHSLIIFLRNQRSLPLVSSSITVLFHCNFITSLSYQWGSFISRPAHWAPIRTTSRVTIAITTWRKTITFVSHSKTIRLHHFPTLLLLSKNQDTKRDNNENQDNFKLHHFRITVGHTYRKDSTSVEVKRKKIGKEMSRGWIETKCAQYL